MCKIYRFENSRTKFQFKTQQGDLREKLAVGESARRRRVRFAAERGIAPRPAAVREEVDEQRDRQLPRELPRHRGEGRQEARPHRPCDLS